MKKVLAVAASARRKGNSDLLLEHALEGIRDTVAPVEVQTILSCELSVTPCRACGRCSRDGRCVVQDEMQELYVKFSEADHVVVASPIYFTSLPGHFKVLIDRFQCFWVRRYRLGQRQDERGEPGGLGMPAGPRRTGMFLCVGAIDRQRYYRSTLTIVKTWLAALNMGCPVSRFYPGLDAPGDVLRHPEYLQDARRAGTELMRHCGQ